MPRITAAQRNSRQRRTDSPPRRAIPPLDGMASGQGMQCMGMISRELQPLNEELNRAPRVEEMVSRMVVGSLVGRCEVKEEQKRSSSSR